MKIENNGVNPLAPNKPTQSAHPVDKNHRAADSASSVSGKDTATLSERAKALAKARAELDQVSDVRTEKVQQLKEQIDSGEYKVDFESLAKKLLSKLGLK